MAKKKRNSSDRQARTGTPLPAAAGAAVLPGSPPTAASRPAPASAAAQALPAEVVRGDWSAPLFATMLFLAPALGVPHEEMLQDTLKSMVVSLVALVAGVLFFWGQRKRREPLRWHGLVWLPLMLTAYALGSMIWSHTYLAGVEVVRWFIFSLLLWLGLNTLSRERLPLLAWGLHGGAVVASLWTALQFWADLKLFPQGPNPASTFVNRNFFAEYVVCVLPFSFLLLARARQSAQVALLAASTGFIIVAILMTGTRSALVAMWLLLLVVLPLIGWLYRRQLAFGAWNRKLQLVALGVLLATVAGLGMVRTGNAKIVAEERGLTPIERGFKRTGSIGPNDHSLGIRMIMWRATGRIILDRPLAGVGAGAWENEVPLYQEPGAQLETDYYVHNEYLQLLAEYGLVGWLFLALLLAYLVAAAWRTWRDRRPEAQAEAPLRALVLAALLALLIVSNAGFPWRMAATGALFALALGYLAASDARLGPARQWAASRLPWQPQFGQAGAVAALAALALGLYVSQVAADAERKIVRAAKLALTVSSSGNYSSPRWDKMKGEMLQLIKEGIELNPHYRKITPIVADELAKWGDWRNATWIWLSVIESRPNVVAILTNVARGYSATNQHEKALPYLERARKIQPDAPSVRSLEVIILGRTGQSARALQLGKEALDRGIEDYDLANTTFVLAAGAGDYNLAARAMARRIKMAPETSAASYLQLGNMFAVNGRDPARAEAAFRSALDGAPDRQALMKEIPPDYWPRLGLSANAAAPALK
ncbi:MAG TPA: O-antigen ligase family protein [Ramlibacter sp.]|nr:O-antigen ligase family protein [Ramlibacter sp.]